VELASHALQTCRISANWSSTFTRYLIVECTQSSRIDDVLLYIEPTQQSLKTFGQKTRELLILACTEVEVQWKYYLDKAGVMPAGQGFRTTDYVRLMSPLYLSEYEVSFPRHSSLAPIRPFATWNPAMATQSLQWYSKYNETKHDGFPPSPNVSHPDLTMPTSRSLERRAAVLLSTDLRWESS
jgi:hypothetical protein